MSHKSCYSLNRILSSGCWNFMITGMWISHLGYLLFSPASRQSSRRHYIACDNLCTHKCTYIEKHLESNEYLFLSEFHDSEIAIAFSSRLKMRIQKSITLYTHNDETTSFIGFCRHAGSKSQFWASFAPS